jgi:HK97 family phage major capsid protein
MAKTPILNAVKYFYGANAQTNIPVLTPSVATPGNYAEGVTNVAADGQAQLVSKVITPYAYVSLLPVSAETLTLGSVNFETELPSIFADAFAQAFHNGILTGDGAGRNMKGLFVGVPTGNQIQCSAAGAPKVVDLVSLQSLISLQNNIINTVNIQFDEAKDTGDLPEDRCQAPYTFSRTAKPFNNPFRFVRIPP